MRNLCNTSRLLFPLLLIFCINVYSHAQDLKPVMNHGIIVISKGNGSILCNDQFNVLDTKEFVLKDNADLSLKFSPKQGYKLSKLTINGINKVSDVEDNHLTLKGISRRTTIVATFNNNEEIDDVVKLTITSKGDGILYYNNQPISGSGWSTDVKRGSFIHLRCEPKKGNELKRLSINGILRDISEEGYSFKIQETTSVNAQFEISSSADAAAAAATGATATTPSEEKPKFEMNVCGPGKASLSGEIQGVIAGNPNDPLARNHETFYVTNGSDVTIRLSPVKNIKRFVVGLKDLTKTVKSSNGIYTVGVTHQFPKFGTTTATAEFTQRYKVSIQHNEYGKYSQSYGLTKMEGSNSYVIENGANGRLWLAANKNCRLAALTVNGINMLGSVTPSQTINTGGGPAFDFDLRNVKEDCKIVITFAPEPKLTIICGQYGSADRAGSIGDPTKYIHHADPDYSINAGSSRSFNEPSAASTSNFSGKPWILRTIANVGYELDALIVNGVDMTSSVSRYPASSPRNNQEICYLSLGNIQQDTRVEITYRPIQTEEWVDLGTGVKWCTHNVGAAKAQDSGYYYSWKEANALKVPKGRLPSYEEIQRLIKECHPEFTQEKGIPGIRFYHRSDRSKSIFIPAAGYYSQSNPDKIEEQSAEGAIWTSDQTGAKSKMGEAMKEHTMNPIWLLIGDAFSSEGFDRAALAFSVKEQVVNAINADIGARMSVRLVLDK